MPMFEELKVFSGTANPDLAESICEYLGIPLGKIDVFKFSNDNTFVRIQENVRQRDVFLIQSFSYPVNDHLMEMLIMIDAAKRASAGRITAVIPYYGYGRTDKKDQPRVPITARLIADLLTVAGANRMLTVDLHAAQIQGFFNVPFDHLFALPVFLNDYLTSTFDSSAVFVSPDAGGVERARAYSKRLGASLAIIDKRRARPNESEVMHLIGDVKGRDCIIVDDLIDTGGTLCNAAKAVMDEGARRVVACATHGVLSGPALQRIEESPLSEVVVTNSIPQRPGAESSTKIRYISIANLLAEAIRRIDANDSVSSLFV